MARRGIDGTGGFNRIASLNAISVSGMASRLSKVVGSSARDAERGYLLAQPGLPLRIGGERPDERSQRRGQRIVRGHHQETHVIDDVLGRKQRAILVGGAA